MLAGALLLCACSQMPSQPAQTQTKQEQLPTINHYIKALCQNLVGNMDYANNKSVFGVTTFAFTDSNLKTAPKYAHHISEALLHEMHMFGLPVIDFKSTGEIQVTPNGDFSHSRNYQELKSKAKINYLVTGTFTPLNDGVWVNAKIIGMASHAVVASGQIFIPERVIQKFSSGQNSPSAANSKNGYNPNTPKIGAKQVEITEFNAHEFIPIE